MQTPVVSVQHWIEREFMLTIAVIIVAAGSGSRAISGAAERPKQYQTIGGAAVLTHSLKSFASHPSNPVILTVIRPGDDALYEQAARASHHPCSPPVYGGATRQQSVLHGLRALLPHNPDKVLIHDAARPFVTGDTISDIITSLDQNTGAIAAVPVTDTLKRGENGVIAATIDRTGLWCAQTPQGFRYKAILAAHEAAAASGLTNFSDDASIAEWHGLRVALIEASADNWKITAPGDFARAERQLTMNETVSPGETRTGSGFDVHAFEPGDHVTLCGVKIPHTHKLKGHSDADAPLHALTDALLGAIGAGDIGDHFPPSDPQWLGADSAIFLAHARDLIAERGARIINVDVTILAERPKIAPYRDAMRARIAAILGLSIDRVGLKATTTEGLGFTGRREGLAALAAASVYFYAV